VSQMAAAGCAGSTLIAAPPFADAVRWGVLSNNSSFRCEISRCLHIIGPSSSILRTMYF
jgi:hypothetical protein